MKRLPILLAGVVGLISGAYMIIYLYRWEWNRAVIAGLFFVATELLVASALIIGRLRRLEAKLDAHSVSAGPGVDAVDPVLGHLRASAPPPKERFSWLRDQSSSMNVFLPVLLGAGVLASGLAWVVQQVARVSTVPHLERRLAGRMGALALPAGGLLAAPSPTATRPRSARRFMRHGVVGVVLVAGGLGSAFGIDYLADRIQTRPDVTSADVETVLELQLRGEVATRTPDRIFTHLWAHCTGPDVFRERRVPDPRVTHGVNGTVSVSVSADFGRHGLDRLTGCLNDATLDKVQASVVSVGTRPR